MSYYVSKRLLSASIVGLLLCLISWVLIPILTADPSVNTEFGRVLSKADAADKATAFVNALHSRNVGLTRKINAEPAVFYHSNSTMAGYINRENLEKPFQKWAASSPFDTYRVLFDVMQTDKPYALRIDVHMTSGRIVGFKLVKKTSPASRSAGEVGDSAPKSAIKDRNPASTLPAQRKLATSLLEQIGWDSAQLSLDEKSSLQDLVFGVPTAQVGQANDPCKIFGRPYCDGQASVGRSCHLHV